MYHKIDSWVPTWRKFDLIFFIDFSCNLIQHVLLTHAHVKFLKQLGHSSGTSATVLL